MDPATSTARGSSRRSRTRITIEQLAWAVREHVANFDHVELFYPEPSPRSARSHAECQESLSDRGRLLGAVHAALGLAEPDPGDR